LGIALLTAPQIKRGRHPLDVVPKRAADLDIAVELSVTVAVTKITAGSVELGAEPNVVVVASTTAGGGMPMLEQYSVYALRALPISIVLLEHMVETQLERYSSPTGMRSLRQAQEFRIPPPSSQLS
jgi:hypothetical protein